RSSRENGSDRIYGNTHVVCPGGFSTPVASGTLDDHGGTDQPKDFVGYVAAEDHGRGKPNQEGADQHPFGRAAARAARSCGEALDPITKRREAAYRIRQSLESEQQSAAA